MTQNIESPQIIDVIFHQNRYSKQIMVVLDRMPKFVYERKKGGNLFAEDGDFVNTYGYEAPSPGFVAFGGREFEIPLKDGSKKKANGQWWDVNSNPFVEEEVVSVGYATLEKLEECYVFISGTIKKKALDNWLANNEASSDYHKYNKQKHLLPDMDQTAKSV